MIRLLLCLVLLSNGAVAQVTPPPQKQLITTLDTLAKTKKDEALLKQKLAASEQEMQAIRERAADLAQQLQQSEARVNNEEETLANVSRNYAQKRAEFEARKAEYTATILSLVRMRQLPPTAMLSSPDTLDTMLKTASVLTKTNEAVAMKAARLRADITQLKQLHGAAKASDIRTRAEKETLSKKREKLDHELALRQQMQAKLNVDHQRAQDRVAELSRQSQSLQELIDKLAEDEKAQARLQATIKKPVDARSLDSKKGSLRVPVTGEVLHRFGEKQNANGTYRGMVFKARAGGAVVAPYDGKIAFIGPFRDYGNMVLIKHKNGYISLIAGLGKISASLNQMAIRGEPIATMPEAGSGEVYVELRDNNAKPIDPAGWFANVIGK